MSNSTTELLSLASELSETDEDYCVVTVVRTANATSAKAGAKAILRTDGTIHGFVGGSCIQSAVRTCALEAIATGQPRLIRVKPKEEVQERVDADGVELHRSSCPSGGTSDLFLEPVRRSTKIVVCGASPVATKLMLLASTMGYHVVAAALAEDHGSLTVVHQTINGFDLSTLDLRAIDAVVVATQGKRDREALVAALATKAAYIGVVGSHRKVATLKAQMADLGVQPTRLESLHGPAGIDISAIEPQEIALSILAEIVENKRHGARSRDVVSVSTSAED